MKITNVCLIGLVGRQRFFWPWNIDWKSFLMPIRGFLWRHWCMYASPTFWNDAKCLLNTHTYNAINKQFDWLYRYKLPVTLYSGIYPYISPDVIRSDIIILRFLLYIWLVVVHVVIHIQYISIKQLIWLSFQPSFTH